MARCGQCKFYIHHLYYNWSSDPDSSFITSMTICDKASDGFFYRGENCVPCSNFSPSCSSRSLFFEECVGEQLTLF